MSKTIVFPEPFESKLKKLKIKTKFIKACKKTTGSIEERYSLCSSCMIYFSYGNNWYRFICSHINWTNSEEGHDYWYNIAIKE